MKRELAIQAPAKINLGLEILGKRADGFHEIRSVLAMVSLYDTLAFSLDPESEGRVVFEDDGVKIDPEDNLVVQAIRGYNRVAGTNFSPGVVVSKRIPIAAGLGGASSDCAATLIAMNAFGNNILEANALSELAAELGSDVPFFLGSPAALVSGRGVSLRPLPNLSGYVLIVSPSIDISEKTKTLYKGLNPSDFTDGSATDHLAATIESVGFIDSSLPGNAFERPLSVISRESGVVARTMTETGLNAHWLTGAGPSRYALVDDRETCEQFAETLRNVFGDRAVVFSVNLVASGPGVNP